MPIHQVETPDGQIIKVEAPEGATDDQILAFAQSNWSPAKPESGDLVRGFKSYFPQTKETFGGVQTILGLGAEKLLGKDSSVSKYLTEHGMQNIKEAQEAQKPLQKESDSFTNAWEKGIGSVITDWLPYQIGQGAANILETGATALGGAAIGSAIPGVGTGVGALEGVVGKSLIKKGVKEMAEKILAEKGEDAAQAYIAKEAKKQIGLNVGLMGQAGMHGVGEVGSRAIEEAEARGQDIHELNLSEIFPAAAVHAAADFVSNKIGLGAIDGLSKPTQNMLMNVGKSVLFTGAKEVPPELLQSAAERYGADLPLSDKNAIDEYINTAAASFGMSVVPGTIGGVRTRSQQPTAEAAPNAPPVAQTEEFVAPVDPNVLAEQERIDAVQAEIARRRAEVGAPPTETLEQRLAGYEAPPEQLSPLEKAAAESERRQAAAASATQLQVPPEEAYAAVEAAARSVEQAGGVASPAQAQLLDQYFPNQRLYDRIEGAETAAPSPIIIPEGRTPRETVRFGEKPSESTDAWEKLTADRQQREAALPTEVQAESPVRPEPQAVLEAINTPAFQQTPEQRLTLQAAEKTYTPEELQLIQTPAFMQTAEQKVQLRGIQRNLDKVVQEANQGNEQAKFQLREAGAEFAPQVQEAGEKIRAELTPYLEKVGLGHVGLQLVNSINNGTADGAYFRNVIQIALDSPAPLSTLRHESIHALKQLNAFSPQEWSYLNNQAKEKWVNEFIPVEKQAQYKDQYIKDNGSEEGFDAYLQEEAIAEAFRAFGDKPKAGILKRIVNKLKAFFDATGNWFRGNGFNSIDSIFSGVEAGKYAPSAEAVAAAKPSAAPKYQLTNAPPKTTTKLSEDSTAGKKIADSVSNMMDEINGGQGATGFRVKFIDVTSSLSERLAKANLPVFDTKGRLRSDMLNHAKSQAINLIHNMVVSGMPMVNGDGTLGIRRSENNLARSQEIADSIDNNPYVKASGLSGRHFVAEVARALRGKDILNEDAERNAKGREQLAEAKAKYKEAKAAAAAGKHVEYKNLMKQVARLRRDGYQNKSLSREKVVDKANIDWAEQQLKNVPEVTQVLDIWRENNHAAVTLWEDVGLLTKEQADKYRSNKHYVPLFKSAEDLDEEKSFLKAGVGAKSTAKIHKLEGGLHSVNVWEAVNKQFAKMVAQAYENQTRAFAAEQLDLIGAGHETHKSDKRTNLRFKRDGKEISFVAENPNDVAAFQSMGYQLGPIMKKLAFGTTVLRHGALINPVFWLKQIIRDPIHSTMVTDAVVTPFHSAKEFASILLKNQSDAYKTLVEQGVIGEVGSTINIKDFIEQFGEKADVKKSKFKKGIDALMHVHESSDAATRVAIYEAAYKKAKAEGMTDEQAKQKAVYTARESINFSIQGNSPLMANARAMIPFLSASITSLDTVYRAWKGWGLNDKEKAQVRELFKRRAMIFTAMTVAYAMMLADDEDYKNVPDDIKDNNWLFPIPSFTEPGKKVFVKIPVPFELGFLFKTLPEAAIRYATGTSTGEEMVKSYVKGLIHNLPTGGVPVPQAIKPILENVTNHSFYNGKPIDSVGEMRLPPEMRGQNASEFSKQLAKFSGFSPNKIDNLINGYFAELGTITTGIAGYTINQAMGIDTPNMNPESYWGLKSFVTNPNVSKSISDFYEIDSQAQQTVNQFNEFKKTGDYKAMEEFVNDPDKVKLMSAQKALSKIGDAMGKIRAQIRLIQNNQDIPPEERRLMINQLQKQQAEIAAVGVDVAKQIKGD